MRNDPTVLASPDYRRLIEDLKARVTEARVSAARHVNRDLILLYWDIGRAIVGKQKKLGWGDSVVEMVATVVFETHSLIILMIGAIAIP